MIKWLLIGGIGLVAIMLIARKSQPKPLIPMTKLQFRK